MSYYLRVYCKAPTPPSLRQLLALMAQKDVSLSIDPDYAEQDLDSADWREVGLVHAEGQTPIWLDIEPGHAQDDGDSEELADMEDELADVADSPAKRKVLEYLHSTQFVAVFQVQGSHSEDAKDAMSAIAGVLIHDYDGIAYADGGGSWEAGYYQGAEPILSLE